MAVNKGEIGIYGVLRRDGGDNVLANTDQIKDKQLNKLQEELNRGGAEHITNTDNPHNVTKEQIGLGNVTNDAQVKRNEMGVANGVATLNANAKIPNNLLDSIIVKYSTTSELPTNGESNKIYIVNNLLYIWDGTKYEEVSKSLDIGTTEGTAYEGSKGKALENNKVDKVEGKQLSTNDYTTAEKTKLAGIEDNALNQTSINNLIGTAINSLSKNSIGLGNVDNTSDKNKPVSTATQTALDNKVDIVTGKSLVLNTEITKLAGLKTQTELDTSISDAKKSGTDAQTTINNHIKDTSNPHNVTKDQVGLSNVDNTADINKEVKTATQLKTTRNIWGKAFNGSADIEGDMNKVTEIYLTDGTKYAEPCTEAEINALFV